MNVENRVFNALFKESKTELESQKVELGQEFSSILKDLSKNVSDSNKQAAQMSKLAKSFIQAKNPDRSGVAKARSSKVNSYFKDYSKKASALDIDVKTTQFYKEYQKALDLIGQLEDNANEIKSIIKSIN